MNKPSTAQEDLGQPREIEECWLSLDGSRLRYLFSGCGPALVLLHGLMGYSFSWRYTMPALAPQASIYAPDMLGTGFSDRPRGLDCHLRASASRLLRFLDALGIAACDLLGSSYGGATAMMAAAQQPDRIRRLILVSPVNPWSAHGKVLSAFLSSRVIAPLFLKLTPYMQIIFGVYLRRLYADTRLIRPGTQEGYAQPLKLPGSFEYALSVLRSWNQDLRDLESALPRIAQIPTLLIWGSRDAAVDPASAVRLEHYFRHGRVLMMDGVGHLPYEETPEEFSRAVAGFLRENR